MNRLRLRRLLFWSATAVVLLIGLILAILYWRSYREVTFDINNQRQTLRLQAETVGDALDAAHITLDPYDEIQPAAPETPLSEAPLISISRAQQVAVQDGVRLFRHYTRLNTPLEIVEQAATNLQAGDVVFINGVLSQRSNTIPTQLRMIQIRRAIEVSVIDGETRRNVLTSADSVGGVLRESGIVLYLADAVQPDLSTMPYEGMEIVLNRSKTLTLIMDGETLNTRARGDTLVEVLPQLGILLMGQDYLIPGEATPFEDGMQVRVVRVRDEIITQQQPIVHETLRQFDAALAPGEEVLLQAGRDGLQEERLRIRYEDEREVSRVVLETRILEAPVDEIIAYGQVGGKDDE